MGLGQVKGKSPESNRSLTRVWQGLRYLSCHLFPPMVCISRKLELVAGLDLNLGTPKWGENVPSGVLTDVPDGYPKHQHILRSFLLRSSECFQVKVRKWRDGLCSLTKFSINEVEQCRLYSVLEVLLFCHYQVLAECGRENPPWTQWNMGGFQESNFCLLCVPCSI